MVEENFLIKIGDPPRVSHTHAWADYIELMALTSADRFFSAGGLEDSLGEVEDLAVDQEGLEELDDQHDAIQRKWADIKNCFISRRARFGNSWPFTIDDKVLRCTIGDDISPRQKLYVVLLLSSCLRYVHKLVHTPITSGFELVGYHIFKKLMPEPWIVKPFGAHQGIEDAYTGTLYNKFVALAEDLKAKLILEEDDLRPGDSGDGGIDVVAWYPIDDSLGNIPVAFAQCGVSLTDLEHKQFEASPVNLNSKILPQHPGMNYYFAPHDIRRSNGKWDKKPAAVIMLDRFRIMTIAERYDLNEPEIINAPHINSLLRMRRIDM